MIVAGTVIFPASVVLCKIIGISGKHDKNNPLAALVIEGTVWMLLSVVIAVGIALHKIEWFYPAMLLVIAGRYLTFSTLYGMKIYWIFGASLAIAAVPLLIYNAPAASSVFTGALIEYAFGIVIFASTRPAF